MFVCCLFCCRNGVLRATCFVLFDIRVALPLIVLISLCLFCVVLFAGCCVLFIVCITCVV